MVEILKILNYMNIIILVLKFSSRNLLYLLYLCQCGIDPANTYSYSSTL